MNTTNARLRDLSACTSAMDWLTSPDAGDRPGRADREGPTVDGARGLTRGNLNLQPRGPGETGHHGALPELLKGTGCKPVVSAAAVRIRHAPPSVRETHSQDERETESVTAGETAFGAHCRSLRRVRVAGVPRKENQCRQSSEEQNSSPVENARNRASPDGYP